MAIPMSHYDAEKAVVKGRIDGFFALCVLDQITWCIGFADGTLEGQDREFVATSPRSGVTKKALGHRGQELYLFKLSSFSGRS